MPRLRVALLVGTNRPTGVVVHTLALAEALLRAGASVRVWGLGEGDTTSFGRRVDPDLETRVVPLPVVAGETLPERVVRSIEVLRADFAPTAADYDVVHAQDLVAGNAAGRCVRTVHRIEQLTHPALAASQERAIVNAHTHVCVSESVAAELRRGWGVEAVVIPNGVDAQRFAAAADPADDEARRKRDGWRERLGRYVLSVGGVEARRGTLDLVEAMGVLHRRLPDVSLVLAGEDAPFAPVDYGQRVTRRARELGVEPVVLGTVPDEELPSLVAAAAAFGYPSAPDGLGMAAMEALSAGVPVISRDLPAVREAFAGAVRYADHPRTLANQIVQALREGGTDSRRRAWMRAEAGRRLAAARTWDVAAERHLALYEEVLAGGRA